MYYKNKNNKSSKKSIRTTRTYAIYAVLFLLLVLAVLFVLEIRGVTNIYTKNKTESSAPTQTGTINYDPPTEQEKQSGNEVKQNLTDDTPEAVNTAEIVIVDASQYDDIVEVRAFIANIIEDGTCTFVFKKNNESISKTTPAKADASSTPCLTLVVNRSEFSQTGTWDLSVSYENTSATGQTSTSLELK